MQTRLTLAALNAVSRHEYVDALGGIFEHSPWVAEAVCDRRPFANLAALHGAMTDAVAAAGPDAQLALIRAHPDLGTRLGRLTASSAAEQAGAGLDRLDEAGYAAFIELNRQYRARFDMPFVIAVRGRTRAEILSAFRERVGHDRATEIATALAEIGQIGRLRLETLLVDDAP